MSLTIPRAGLDAGRAANAAAMPAQPNLMGEAMAKLGNVMQQRGEAIQAENDNLALQRINVQMAADMGRVRQELDQSNDPNIGQVWEARSAEIRAKYIDQIPQINAGLRDRAALVYDDMNSRHSLAVGQRAIATRASYREAQWIEQSGTIAAEAASAPQESLDDMFAAADANITTRLAAGDITPAQAAEERAKFRSDVLTARARADIARDPAAFLAGSDQYQELGTGQADLRTMAEVELARRQEAAAKAEEVAVKERSAAIGGALGEMKGIFEAGQTSADEAFLTNPEVQAHPDYPEVMAAKSLRDEKIFLGQKTPDELLALIYAEKAKPKGRAWETERLKVLEGALEATKTAWAANSVDAARKAGLIAADDVLTFDPANPQAFAQGLARRMTFDETTRPKYTQMGQAIMATDEMAAIKPVMAPEADAAPKVALLGAYAAQDKPAVQVDAALALAGGGDVEKRAVRLLKTTGDTTLVETMLRGQQQVKLGVVALPPEKNRMLVFSDATGGVFDDSPQLAAQLMASASALYAAEAAGVNPDGNDAVLPFMDDTEAQQMFANAVQRVTGVAPDRNGDLAIGGLQEVNGAKVVLPRGVHREEAEMALENITAQLSGMQFNAVAGTWVRPEMYAAFTESPTARIGDQGTFDSNPSAEQVLQQDGQISDTQPVWMGYEKGWVQPDPNDPSFGMRKPVTAGQVLEDKLAGVNATVKPDLDPMRAFKAASVGGPAAPALGQDPARKMQDVQFRRVGETDIYEMVRMVDGRTQVIPIEGDAQGRAYRFRMTDLIKGAQQ